MRAILSELVRQDRLVVVEEVKLDQPRTKAFISLLNDLSLPANVLVISEQVDENLYLASRNIPYVEVRDVAGADPVSLVGFEKVLITVAALKKFEEMLG